MTLKRIILTLISMIAMTSLASAVNLSISPVTQNVQTGNYFYVIVTLDSLTYTVKCAVATVTYPAANMTALSMTYDSLLGGSVMAIPVITAGTASYSVCRTDDPVNHVAVNGDLFTIQFYPSTSNTGHADINITYAEVVNDTDVILTSYNITNGSVDTSYFAINSSSTVFKTLPHDVEFQVMDYMNNLQNGVYVTAQGYNTTVGSFNILASMLGLDFTAIPINNQLMYETTGNDGSVVFKMDGSIYYRITFVKLPNINITWWLSPKDDYYTVLVPTSNSNTVCGDVSYNLTNVVKNPTQNTLGLTYYNPSGTTTLINFFVQYPNNTYLYQTSVAATSTWTITYDVNSSRDNTYFWGFNATSTGCSDISQTKVIQFKGTGRYIDLGIADDWYQWLSICGIVFVAAMFSIRKNRFGVVIIPFFAQILYAFGWFTISPVLLGSACVIGIIIYIRSSEVKVNY